MTGNLCWFLLLLFQQRHNFQDIIYPPRYFRAHMLVHFAGLFERLDPLATFENAMFWGVKSSKTI